MLSIFVKNSKRTSFMVDSISQNIGTRVRSLKSKSNKIFKIHMTSHEITPSARYSDSMDER